MTKLISYDGVAAATTDDVADALLELALVVARHSSDESVTIPVAVDGRREELTMMLGPTIHLSALTDPAEVELDGAPRTAADLRRRAEAFTDPFSEHPSGRTA